MTADELFGKRTRLGLSTYALANEIGVNQSTVSRWETGRSPIPAWVARLLATIERERPDPSGREGVAR